MSILLIANGSMQSEHKFKSPIFAEIMVQISLKFIHTFSIDNPLPQPVPLVSNCISGAKIPDI